jgi:hypothetical protein
MIKRGIVYKHASPGNYIWDPCVRTIGQAWHTGQSAKVPVHAGAGRPAVAVRADGDPATTNERTEAT